MRILILLLLFPLNATAQITLGITAVRTPTNSNVVTIYMTNLPGPSDIEVSSSPFGPWLPLVGVTPTGTVTTFQFVTSLNPLRRFYRVHVKEEGSFSAPPSTPPAKGRTLSTYFFDDEVEEQEPNEPEPFTGPQWVLDAYAKLMEALNGWTPPIPGQ